VDGRPALDDALGGLHSPGLMIEGCYSGAEAGFVDLRGG